MFHVNVVCVRVCVCVQYVCSLFLSLVRGASFEKSGGGVLEVNVSG